MGNAIVDATGVWKQTKWFPFTEVQLGIPLRENPSLAHDMILQNAMKELLGLYPGISKIIYDIKSLDDLGPVLYLTIKGKIDLHV